MSNGVVDDIGTGFHAWVANHGTDPLQFRLPSAAVIAEYIRSWTWVHHRAMIRRYMRHMNRRALAWVVSYFIIKRGLCTAVRVDARLHEMSLQAARNETPARAARNAQFQQCVRMMIATGQAENDTPDMLRAWHDRGDVAYVKMGLRDDNNHGLVRIEAMTWTRTNGNRHRYKLHCRLSMAPGSKSLLALQRMMNAKYTAPTPIKRVGANQFILEIPCAQVHVDGDRIAVCAYRTFRGLWLMVDAKVVRREYARMITAPIFRLCAYEMRMPWNVANLISEMISKNVD
jgi:hypothetical protein